mmetsp:Transcript_974/g.4132  ORF Transcript_974/g.4132 Transcript_974/m.4132 type:complete len:208 (-) Transcript_974:1144-1767(-)
MEGRSHQELGTRAFDAHHVQEHVVGYVETAVQRLGFPVDHVLADLRAHLLIEHQDDDAPGVQAASSCATGHLNVLAGKEPPEIGTVVLPALGEDHRLGRHVDADAERLRGEQDLQQPFSEENLDNLLQGRQHAAVVDAYHRIEALSQRSPKFQSSKVPKLQSSAAPFCSLKRTYRCLASAEEEAPPLGATPCLRRRAHQWRSRTPAR